MLHKAKLQEEWARREHWIFKEPFEKRSPKKGRNRERLLFTAAQSSDNRNRHRFDVSECREHIRATRKHDFSGYR